MAEKEEEEERICTARPPASSKERERKRGRHPTMIGKNYGKEYGKVKEHLEKGRKKKESALSVLPT